jgi:hypothetical protein
LTPRADVPKPIRIHLSSSSRSTGAATISSGRYEVFTSPRGAREPATGDDPGALCSDVVAALSRFAKVINQRLEFGPFGG